VHSRRRMITVFAGVLGQITSRRKASRNSKRSSQLSVFSSQVPESKLPAELRLLVRSRSFQLLPLCLAESGRDPYPGSQDSARLVAVFPLRPKHLGLDPGSCRSRCQKVALAPLPRRSELILMPFLDRKSTRLNSSHEWISYAVFCFT